MALSAPAATLHQYKSYIKSLFIQLITSKKICTFLSIKTSYASKKKQEDFNNVLVLMNFKLIQSKYTQTTAKKQVYSENSERQGTIGQARKELDREYRIRNTTTSGYRENDIKRYRNSIPYNYQIGSILLYKRPEGATGGVVRRNTSLTHKRHTLTNQTTKIRIRHILTKLVKRISHRYILTNPVLAVLEVAGWRPAVGWNQLEPP